MFNPILKEIREILAEILNLLKQQAKVAVNSQTNTEPEDDSDRFKAPSWLSLWKSHEQTLAEVLSSRIPLPYEDPEDVSTFIHHEFEMRLLNDRSTLAIRCGGEAAYRRTLAYASEIQAALKELTGSEQLIIGWMKAPPDWPDHEVSEFIGSESRVYHPKAMPPPEYEG